MTLFEEKVYRAVRKIPCGKVFTYAEVALAIGRPRSFRAVGNALNKNYNQSVPCHRVIRSDGKAGGYNKGVQNKIKLLKSEGLKI